MVMNLRVEEGARILRGLEFNYLKKVARSASALLVAQISNFEPS